MIKKTVLVVLACIIMNGSFLFSSITVKAAHEPTCNEVLYFREAHVYPSTYTHNSQYGKCVVSVKETYDEYRCNCNYLGSYRNFEKEETHSQPHG